MRFLPHQIEALDAFIAAQPEPRPGRPEVVRALVDEALAAKGPITPAEAHVELTHEIKALEHDLATIPAVTEQSPEAALHRMDRAIVENELIELRHKRKRIRKAKPK